MFRAAGTLLVTVTIVGVLASGCGSGSAKSASATSTRAATASTVSKYDSGPRAGESSVDGTLAKQGERLFQEKGCSACHTFGKRSTGPDLQGVSMRRTAQWMEEQILHPDVMTKEDPIARQLFAQFALQMPKQGLTADEAKAVIEYFKHQDHEAGEKD